MNKIYYALVILSSTYSVQGMFMMNRLKHSQMAGGKRVITGQKVRVLGQKRFFSTHNLNSDPQSKTIRVSEKCYQDWQNISEDVAKFKYYMQGVCNSMGESGRADVKPSAILQFLRDKSDINDATQLKYMPAADYMHFFLTDKNYDELDEAFVQKQNDTQNLQETWNWFHDYFTQSIKTALEGYGKDMMERDAAKVVLAEHGIEFKNNGRTISFDLSRMSEDPEDMAKVREAFDKIYKE